MTTLTLSIISVLAIAACLTVIYLIVFRPSKEYEETRQSITDDIESLTKIDWVLSKDFHMYTATHPDDPLVTGFGSSAKEAIKEAEEELKFMEKVYKELEEDDLIYDFDWE